MKNWLSTASKPIIPCSQEGSPKVRKTLLSTLWLGVSCDCIT